MGVRDAMYFFLVDGPAITRTLFGSVDNVLRPKLVGGDTKMPDFLILLSTPGGLRMFAAAGIIAGPVIAGLFLTVWDIFALAFHDALPDAPLLIADKGTSPAQDTQT